MSTLDDRIDAWARAEQDGDATALEALLHPDFLAVGPYGFLLDREQWIRRFTEGLKITDFAFAPDVAPRHAGGNAFVVGTQTQRGSHGGRPIDGEFRVTLVLTDAPQWRLIAVHLSQRTLPGAPAAGARPTPG